MKEVMEGGCLCGALRFRISGKSLGSGQCCCPDCRTICGGGPANAFVVSGDSIEVTKGVPKTFASENHNGTTSIREFCDNCGTPLFGSKISSPGTVAVMVGALDDDSDFRPRAISWVSTAPEWLKLDAHLPKFEKDIVGGAP